MQQRDVTPLQLDSAAHLPSLPEFVYAKLREEILAGAVPEGALLRQEGIAARLGVSRLPVREALARLEADGLVVSRPRRGYAVALLDLDEITEIFDLRMMLEERAGYVAAQRRGEDDIREVQALLAEMDSMSIASAEDAVRFSLRNRMFHDRLFAASGHRHTCRLMLTLRNNVERYIQIGAWMLGSVEQVRQDHRAIFEAFRKGDAEAVARLSRRHVQSTGERLVAMIRRQRGEHPAPGGGLGAAPP